MNVVSEQKKFIEAIFSYSRVEIFPIWIEQTQETPNESELHRHRSKSEGWKIVEKYLRSIWWWTSLQLVAFIINKFIRFCASTISLQLHLVFYFSCATACSISTSETASKWLMFATIFSRALLQSKTLHCQLNMRWKWVKWCISQGLVREWCRVCAIFNALEPWSST